MHDLILLQREGSSGVVVGSSGILLHYNFSSYYILLIGYNLKRLDMTAKKK